MKNIEYTLMAKLYDQFYASKNYEKEVNFITNFVHNKDCNILDAGCGTGNHAQLLHNLGYNVHGFDLNIDMVNIANSKLQNKFEVGNILNFTTNKKYDVIISFFAVFNHLKSYKEFKKALSNLSKILKNDGCLIIDLHNPQKNGTKKDIINNSTRIMKWRVSKIVKKEFTQITYVIDQKIFKTRHVFKTFKIDKLRKIANKLGFQQIQFYENYNIDSTATQKSKNLQMILQKNKNN